MDLAKYQNLFLEEATDHLAEMAGALLQLEKDPTCSEAIDLAFRMAHSIKGMAGSLGYDSITEVAHRFEDRMSVYRASGRVDAKAGIGALFRGLEGLEAMVAHVREHGETPPPESELAALLGAVEAETDPTPTPEPEPDGAQAQAVFEAPRTEQAAPPKKVSRRR